MSKVINFNARDFEFDNYCDKNVGFRGFISTPYGNEEIWEIGDWNWNWTQICAVYRGLTPDTDYVFRFAMTLGHNDDNKEESLVNIFPFYPDEDPYDTRPEDNPERLAEEQTRKKAWNDRYTYCTKMSRFRPVISKRDTEQDTMIRVFELPFRTDSHTEWKVMFVSQHAIARLFRAKDNEAYEGLEDLTYEQWREQRTKTLEEERLAKIRSIVPDLDDLGIPRIPDIPKMPGFSGIPEEILRQIPEDVLQRISDSYQHIGRGAASFSHTSSSGGNASGKPGYIDLSGAVIHSQSQFERIMQLAEEGKYVNLSGAILEFDCDDDDDEDDEDDDEDEDEE